MFRPKSFEHGQSRADRLVSEISEAMVQSLQLGRQERGGSHREIKEMALRAIKAAVGSHVIPVAVDVGAGAGEFATCLSRLAAKVVMLDWYTPETIPPNAEFRKCDLNDAWPLPEEAADYVCALEVIEHVENPRHFVRQMARATRPSGWGYLSTPNNHSWTSKLTFVLKGQHRLFQASSYPAHITPLLRCDLLRILAECQLIPLQWFYSNRDTVPRVHWPIRLRGRAFSDSLGLLFQKPAKSPNRCPAQM